MLVGRILSAVKNSGLYPDGHPILERLLDDAYTTITEHLNEVEQLEFRIAGNVLIVNGNPLKDFTKAAISKFITLLGLRQIGLLAFLRGMDRDEFTSFLNLLALEPQELQKEGGSFSSQLADHDIQHVVAEEIAYGSKERRGITLDWDDFHRLLSTPEALMAEIEHSPESVADLITKTAGARSPEAHDKSEWMERAVGALQKIADSLFDAYAKTQPEEYVQRLARVALALNPSLQRELIGTKSDQEKWSQAVEVMISEIPDEQLVDLVVAKFGETAREFDGAPDTDSRNKIAKRTQDFLRKVFTNPERENRLLPAVKSKLSGTRLAEGIWPELSPETSPDSNLLSLLEIELSSKPPLSVDTLVTMKMALDARADIEKLVHPFIAALDEENPETRKYVSERLRQWTKEIIVLGRYDLVETIIEKMAEHLRIEATLDLYESLVATLADIAIALLKREKHSYVERITGILADYLSGVKDQPQGKMLTKALGQIGDKTALKELVSLLGSTELDAEAGRWIVRAGNDAIQPLLRGLRIVEDKNTRLRMVEVASQLGEEVLPAVMHELKDSRWYVRRNACTVLSKLPYPQALKQLSYLLHDSVSQVREEAIVAISKTKSEEAENLILPMTMDKELSVQHTAIEALGKIGTESSVATLISFLQTSRFRKRKESLRSAVLGALGAIGGWKTKEFLMEVVTKRSWRGPKYSEKMRKEAIEILGKLGGIDCRVVLLKATKDKSDVVKAAALMALRKSSRKDTPIP